MKTDKQTRSAFPADSIVGRIGKFIDPIHGFVPMALPYKPKDKDELIDWKEVRTYPKIGGECFDSLYFGINIDKEEKEKIIKVAKERNPEIKIYQMTIDPEAFRLKGELI